MNETQTIGLGVLGFGVALFFLGILMLFDRALLVMSNLLILISIVLLMGPEGVLKFIVQKDKMRGTAAFLAGIFLVLIKIPYLGIPCEIAGAYWLFGGFIPLLVSLLLKVPFLTTILPFLAKSKEELPL